MCLEWEQVLKNAFEYANLVFFSYVVHLVTIVIYYCNLYLFLLNFVCVRFSLEFECRQLSMILTWIIYTVLALRTWNAVSSATHACMQLPTIWTLSFSPFQQSPFLEKWIYNFFNLPSQVILFLQKQCGPLRVKRLHFPLYNFS